MIVFVPTAVSVTVSRLAHCTPGHPDTASGPITNCIPGNMPVESVTPTVAEAPRPVTAPVKMSGVAGGGTAMLPAWPISCWSNSVALRTLECIAVRFEIVPCVIVIWNITCATMAETESRIPRAIISSISENPDSPPEVGQAFLPVAVKAWRPVPA